MAITDTPAPDTEKITDKIRKLLAKAEGTDNEAEATVFMEKAQRLMRKHAIDLAMLHANERPGGRDAADVTETSFVLGDRYHAADQLLIQVIAKANGCGAYATRGLDFRGRLRNKEVVVGFPEDIEMVELLVQSLTIQLERFIKTEPTAVAHRRQYRYGYAVRVGERLKESQAQVVKEETARDGSLLPVLADKDQMVRNAMPATTKRRTSMGGAGYDRGRAAANRADVGGARIGGAAGALPAGR